MTQGFARAAAMVQGLYYVATGLLPLVSMRLFEAITWPKTDDWLVVMVGLLAVAIGVALLRAVRLRSAFDACTLGVGSAVAFAVMDVWVVARGIGSPAYLVDLAVEVIFLGLWTASSRRALS